METMLLKQVSPAKIARIATGAAFFMLGVGTGTWASRIPDIQERLGLNAAELGGVLLGMPVGSFLSLLPAGWVVTRFGSRKVILYTAIAFAIVLPCLGLAATPWLLVLSLFGFGVCADVMNIALNTQAVTVEEQLGKSIMSSFHALWSVGAMVGALTGGLMIAWHISPIQHFAFIGVALVVLTFIFYQHLLPNDRQTRENQPLFALPDRPLLLFGLIAFCAMLTEGSMADWSSIYYKQTLTAGTGIATTGYTAFTLTMSLIRFAGDWLTERVGIRKLLQISGLLVALGMGLAVTWPTSIVVIIGFMLIGIGVATVVPLVYSAAGRSESMSAGVALAAVSTVGISGFLFGPVLIGFIAEATTLRFALGLVVFLGLGITLLTSRVKV